MRKGKEIWRKFVKEIGCVKSQILNGFMALISLFTCLFTSIFEYGIAVALRFRKAGAKIFAIMILLLVIGAGLAMAGNIVVRNGLLMVTDSFYVNEAGDTLYVNSSTGRVGIGTTTPGEKLYVVGNINATGAICDSNGCVGSGSGVDSDWVIDGNNMSSGVSGNVGIGTTGPDTKLHIQGGLCVDDDDACTDPGAGNVSVEGTLEVNTRFILPRVAGTPAGVAVGDMWIDTT